jgi:hypothetical protein
LADDRLREKPMQEMFAPDVHGMNEPFRPFCFLQRFLCDLDPQP